MTEIVVNNCYGGFRLSPKAMVAYYGKKGITVYFYDECWTQELLTRHIRKITVDDAQRYAKGDYSHSVGAYSKDFGDYVKDFDMIATAGFHVNSDPEDNRDDPDLIAVVKALGDEANTDVSDLAIVEIPDGIEWIIETDDEGHEWVAEKHHVWYPQ